MVTLDVAGKLLNVPPRVTLRFFVVVGTPSGFNVATALNDCDVYRAPEELSSESTKDPTVAGPRVLI